MLRTTTLITGTAGGPYYSTFHFEGTLQAEADAAAIAARTFWDGIKTQISTGAAVDVLDEVEVVDVPTGQVTQVYISPTASVAPSGGGDYLPRANQGLIRWLTGIYVAGRQLRGRTFIPGATELMSTNGTPDTSYKTPLQTAANALVGTSDFGVYSPTHGQFILGATASVWDKWAVLRSRRD